MDTGTLHRLAILCKDYYSIRKINDLFIYAGADPGWWVDPIKPLSGERVSRFYGWIEGIQKNAPNLFKDIIKKVLLEFSQNAEVSEKDLLVISNALAEMQNEEIADKGIRLEPLLGTLVRMMANEGKAREVAIITYSKSLLQFGNYDQFLDMHFATLILEIPYKLYQQIADEKTNIEQVILEQIHPLQRTAIGEAITEVTIVPAHVSDDKWREKATAWLAGKNVNNQGKVRSDNVAPITHDGLQFRSKEEVNLYKALKQNGVSFAPLPVFLRGGETYRRIEPDFVIIKSGVVMVVEVDGDTVHHESPAEADTRTMMLEDEGVDVFHVSASECRTPELASRCAKKIIQRLDKLKQARS